MASGNVCHPKKDIGTRQAVIAGVQMKEKQEH
jgi:hypothetical protein